MADVLREFFELRDDGWHQKRADEEIARYRAKMPDLEAKKENDRERQRRARDRRKQLFESLRDHGIVPPWDATTAQLQDALSRATTDTGDAAVTPPVTEPVTRDNTATHSPYTNNHKNSLPSVGSSARATDAVTGARDGPSEPTLAGQACRLMREAGIHRVNPSDPRLLQLLSQGVTPQQIADLAAEIREGQGAGKPQTYVLAAMEGRLRDAAAMPQHPPDTAQRAIGRRQPSRQDRISATVAALTGRDRQHEPETIDVIATEQPS